VANVSGTLRRSASDQVRNPEVRDQEAAEEVTVMIVLIAALYRWWNAGHAKRLAADNRRTTL
jgi:hypothetical protein